MIPMRSATTSSSAAFALSFRRNRTAPRRSATNKRLYRQRNCIERVLGHLKINRAIATRYDQFADSFLGMLYLATAR
jgi:transposase